MKLKELKEKITEEIEGLEKEWDKADSSNNHYAQQIIATKLEEKREVLKAVNFLLKYMSEK